jgi:hypothetical protein
MLLLKTSAKRVKEKCLQAFDVLKLQFLELKKTQGEEKSISLCLGRDTSAEKDLGENHAQQ